MADDIRWFAGVDWGSEKHHACLVDVQGEIVVQQEFPHRFQLTVCAPIDIYSVVCRFPIPA